MRLATMFWLTAIAIVFWLTAIAIVVQIALGGLVTFGFIEPLAHIMVG